MPVAGVAFSVQPRPMLPAYGQRHGLSSSTPIGSKSATLRVTTHRCAGAAAVPTGRGCRAETSGQVGRAKQAGAKARRVELEVAAVGLVQQLANAGALADQAPVGVVAHQHLGGLASVGDDDRPGFGRALGLADVLIEVSAGEGDERHDEVRSR